MGDFSIEEKIVIKTEEWKDVGLGALCNSPYHLLGILNLKSTGTPFILFVADFHAFMRSPVNGYDVFFGG